ncbi:hypothetical protein A7X88_11495 [Stenotrophomonas maltophilia]|nr:hypothetical protein A7X88_11495 [Stenotrophomonas maltophilia]
MEHVKLSFIQLDILLPRKTKNLSSPDRLNSAHLELLHVIQLRVHEIDIVFTHAAQHLIPYEGRDSEFYVRIIRKLFKSPECVVMSIISGVAIKCTNQNVCI